MSDPLTKYILLALVPVIVTLVTFSLAFFAIKYKFKKIIDFINYCIWDFQETETNKGKIFGRRVFSKTETIEHVDNILLYGAANLLGISFTLWWRIIFFQITTSATCLTDYDCFITDTSKLIGFPIYEQCNNLSELFSINTFNNATNNTVLVCVQFTIPSIDNLYTTVGVSYGTTAVAFSILRFIMTLDVSENLTKIILIASSILYICFILMLIFLLSFLRAFISWLTDMLINYLVPILIVNSVFIAIALFGYLNIKLGKLSNGIIPEINFGQMINNIEQDILPNINLGSLRRDIEQGIVTNIEQFGGRFSEQLGKQAHTNLENIPFPKPNIKLAYSNSSFMDSFKNKLKKKNLFHFK